MYMAEDRLYLYIDIYIGIRPYTKLYPRMNMAEARYNIYYRNIYGRIQDCLN